MLDFGVLKAQIDEMAVERKDLETDYFRRIDRALGEMDRWAGSWEDLEKKIASSRTSWLVAQPSGPIAETHPLPKRPQQLTVIASDGSQIFPDRHEVANCYLINIGYVAIHYGTGERPVMSSRPTLFFREDDVYPEWAGRRTTVTRDMVGIKRGAMEFEQVAELAESAWDEGRMAVGLCDGTLILWMLEGKPLDFRKQALASYLAVFDRLRKARVPVAGYISDPGSVDVVNALRVGLCQERPPNCDRCPWKAQQESSPGGNGQGTGQPGLPCEPIAGVTDDVVLARTLGKGERSGVFGSVSKILDDYGPHRTHFFYVHTGSEVARIEIPRWVADDPALLDLVHVTVCDQAEKGGGYPVVLSESHEKAVVRAAERDLFYRFLRDSFVENEVKAEVSLKSLKKMAAGV
ncbi:MAG: DNA double-strand break repair nuclease NurA [Candidatus Latescibacteria bacterium]|jgi:hypothetical protein|nr:DNA double-strand break repair nuclease NurA [Candidatus Latescibacterota bacterium]